MKPIKAYAMLKRLNFAGINSVRKPSPNAEIAITLATIINAVSGANLDPTYIFPDSATKVIPIMRMDQLKVSDTSNSSNSKNRLGRASKKIALNPKTIEPALRICLSIPMYLSASTNSPHV